MDLKLVTLLTNAHNPEDGAEVMRKNKDGTRLSVTCLSGIRDYNRIMGVVDKFDQLKGRCVIRRRSKKGDPEFSTSSSVMPS